MDIIGIDPDSKKYGVAHYCNGSLIELSNLSHYDLILKLQDLSPDLICIENVIGNKFLYSRYDERNISTRIKISESVGRCKQSQVLLQEYLDKIGLKYLLIKPSSGNWENDKKRFSRITGWSGRSNSDNRSAAYFGYLAVLKTKK